MDAYEIADLARRRGEAGKAYLEFIRVPALSVGIYTLAAGAVDPQQPHSEDEVYHIIAGRAHIMVAGETREVGPGSVVYVAAGVEHHFFDIAEELTTLVFFAPAEGSTA